MEIVENAPVLMRGLEMINLLWLLLFNSQQDLIVVASLPD
jgi:hypothetical protein